MSNTKTEAQRLADELDSRNPWDKPLDRGTVNSAATELRSLDAQNKAMHKIIDQLRAQLDQAVQQYKEDAERYRWLADSNNYYEAINLISDGSLTEDALGKAIDAAMAKGVKG